MSKKLQNAMENSTQDEIKTRIPLWLYPSTIQTIDKMMPLDNCKSRSEFLEKSALFYAGYVAGKDAASFLPTALVSALRATVTESEKHICRMLFKLTVELDMMMNVLAAGLSLQTDSLHGLRNKCVQEVSRTNGQITLKDAVEYQREKKVI